MFLSGCFTTRTLDNAHYRMAKGYTVDAVESAERLPNGDIVLSVKGRERSAADSSEPNVELDKTINFTLLISSKEIQTANEQDKERQKAGKNYYDPGIPAIRQEMSAVMKVKDGTPLLVLQMQKFDLSNATPVVGTNAVAILVAYDRFIGRNRIGYVEQRDDGSVFRVSVDPKPIFLDVNQRKYYWLLPLAVVGDVVTFPFQVVAYTVYWLEHGPQ